MTYDLFEAKKRILQIESRLAKLEAILMETPEPPKKEKPVWKCPVCEKVFKTQEGYLNHIVVVCKCGELKLYGQ